MAGTNKNARRHQLARMGASRVWVIRNPSPYAVRKLLPYAVRKLLSKKKRRRSAK